MWQAPSSSAVPSPTMFGDLNGGEWRRSKRELEEAKEIESREMWKQKTDDEVNQRTKMWKQEMDDEIDQDTDDEVGQMTSDELDQMMDWIEEREI